VFMARNRTTRHGFILSSRSHAVRTWRTAHRFQLSSMHPTIPIPNTCRLPRCPCRHSPLHQPVPSLSRKSSNAMCLLPRNSRIRSRGTIRTRSAQVPAGRWRSRQTQDIRSACRLLQRLPPWYRQAVMSSPNAKLPRHPRTSTLNTLLLWRVRYTDARLGPSFPFMARGVTQVRRLALGAVPVRTFQTSQVRARGLTTMADEGRAYRQVRC
jgi:hypothetical protein